MSFATLRKSDKILLHPYHGKGLLALDLKIPDNYFCDEEREGFLITAKMKRCWAAQIKLMMMIGEICDRHNLRWYIDYGTLLGAVRHRGFVPWDDDIDLSMPRADYDRALPILARELPGYCNVHIFGTELNYQVAWSYVSNRTHIDTGDSEEEAIISDQFYGSPYRDGIDLFPMDHVPKKDNAREDFLSIYKLIFDVVMHYDNLTGTAELEQHVKNIESLTNVRLPRDRKLLPALCHLAEDVARFYDGKPDTGINNIANMADHSRKQWREQNWYRGVVYLPFEMVRVPAPIGYLKILESVFGPNWIKPIQGKAKHDYPFYKDQDQWIWEYHLDQTVKHAEALESDGKLVEAREYLADALEQYPESYQIYYTLARVVLDADVYLARDCMREALRLCDNEEYQSIISQELQKFDVLD